MTRLKTLKPRLTAVSTSRVKPQERKTATNRGYNYRWQQARARYLRANPLCVMCRDEERVEAATVVDHVIPHQGYQQLFWDESNWQALCKTHHDSHKQKQEHEAGYR